MNLLKKIKKKNYIILDIPLLLEKKLNKKKDILIFIDAPKKEIIKRLKKRKNYNSEIINTLKKLQLPLEIKRKKSNFVIKNNFNNDSIKKSVKSLLKQFN